MWKLLKKLQLPLSIVSVLIAILLGGKALWDWWAPISPLVGELITTESRMPAEIVKEYKGLPEGVRNSLGKNKELRVLIPKDSTRAEVIGVLVDTIEGNLIAFDLREISASRLFVLTVHNYADRPLKNVRVGSPYFSAHTAVTIVPPTGEAQNVSGRTVFDLGDLPPNAEVKLFSWGIGVPLGPEGMTLSHDQGVGEIRHQRSIPSRMQQGGLFISYQYTTIAVVALFLFYLGADGISRYYSSRRKKLQADERPRGDGAA